MPRVKYEVNFTEDLNELPSGGTTGQVLVKKSNTNYNANWKNLNEIIEIDGNFIDLDDTPATYTGQAGKVATVNEGEDGIEFIVPESGGGGGLVETHTLGEDIEDGNYVYIKDGKAFKRKYDGGTAEYKEDYIPDFTNSSLGRLGVYPLKGNKAFFHSREVPAGYHMNLQYIEINEDTKEITMLGDAIDVEIPGYTPPELYPHDAFMISDELAIFIQGAKKNTNDGGVMNIYLLDVSTGEAILKDTYVRTFTEEGKGYNDFFCSLKNEATPYSFLIYAYEKTANNFNNLLSFTVNMDGVEPFLELEGTEYVASSTETSKILYRTSEDSFNIITRTSSSGAITIRSYEFGVDLDLPLLKTVTLDDEPVDIFFASSSITSYPITVTSRKQQRMTEMENENGVYYNLLSIDNIPYIVSIPQDEDSPKEIATITALDYTPTTMPFDISRFDTFGYSNYHKKQFYATPDGDACYFRVNQRDGTGYRKNITSEIFGFTEFSVTDDVFLHTDEGGLYHFKKKVSIDGIDRLAYVPATLDRFEELPKGIKKGYVVTGGALDEDVEIIMLGD